jgi:hypothetical protein
MDGSEKPAQRRFWNAILCLARLQRSRKSADFQTARDALEVEEMATERLKLLQDDELNAGVPAVGVADPLGASPQGG